MGNPYPGTQLWLLPITLTTDNNTVEVTEDPGGAGEASFTASLPVTGDAALSGALYYGFNDTINQAPYTVFSHGRLTLKADPLYARLSDLLSNNSPNGWTYSFLDHTPSGSELGGSSVKLTASGGDFRLEFASSLFEVDPRLFGFPEDHATDETSSASVLTGDVSRYYVWQPPAGTTIDKRHEDRRRTFTSTGRADAYRWRWTRPDRRRVYKYREVAAAHVWPDDRAGRQSEADRAGLPLGDANNAMKQLFELGAVGDQRVLVSQNRDAAVDDLLSIDSHPVEAVALQQQFASSWAPHQGNGEGDRYAGEQYDLQIPVGYEDPDSYVDFTPYRH